MSHLITIGVNLNSRITARERGLIKGAIRRAFSRSDLRKTVIEACIVPHIDSSRPRVKSWGLCAECNKPTPKSYLVVDHKEPVIPLNRSFEDMSLDEVVDRMWCPISNLQPICEDCHLTKTKQENKVRRANKKEKKNERSKTVKRSAKTTITRSSKGRTNSASRKISSKTNQRKIRCN